MSKADYQKWWHEKETQDMTIDLMGRFDIIMITSDLNEKGKIIVKVGTLDGSPIEGFPSNILGKQVVYFN